MAAPKNGDLKAELDAAQAAATKQGDTVRSLKALAKDSKADKARRCLLELLERGINSQKIESLMAASSKRVGMH